MAQEESMKVIQVYNIEPIHEPTKLSQSPTSLPLTFFDILWLRFPPIQRLFFYEFTKPTSFFYDHVLPNLKKSLSYTLQHFLPFAGNIIWPIDSSIPIINYVQGDYVSFIVVESKENFKELSSNYCEASKRHHLIPLLKISDEKASLISIQITLFPNNGFCIGIATHHAALDGKSSTTFLKAWSYICSNLEKSSPAFFSLDENLTPFFDRSLIQLQDNDGISETYVDTLMNLGGPNNKSLKVWEFPCSLKNDAIKGLFELTPSNIKNLKEHAQNGMKNININLSSFSVSCAYLLSCLAKSEQPKDDKVIFSFSVDCRTRLEPPISSLYIGNCVDGKNIVLETKYLVGKDGYFYALEAINKTLNSVKNDGVLIGAKNRLSKWFSPRESTKFYSIGGSPRFEVYGIDFGFGKPKKVDMTSIDKTGAFSISESRNHHGGIEIGLTLNKEVMEIFSTLFVEGLESF